MIASRTWHDRLPSAAAAIALQGGLLALLAFSFAVVRHVAVEKETFLALPPLAQEKTQPQQKRPASNDARPNVAAPTPPATAGPPMPAWATPGFALGGGQNGIRLAQPPSLDACRPENYTNLNTSDRKACSRGENLARQGDGTLPLNPNKPVRNAPVWQAEIDRRNGPMVLPGGDIFGTALTLLFNPQAFTDKRNYSYAQPDDAAKVDGAEATHRLWSQPPQCAAGLDDTSMRVCQANAAATYNHGGAMVYHDHPHVADAAFQKARAATQARTKSFYSPPAPASGAPPDAPSGAAQ